MSNCCTVPISSSPTRIQVTSTEDDSNMRVMSQLINTNTCTAPTESQPCDDNDWEVTDTCPVCGNEHYKDDVADNRLKCWDCTLEARGRIARRIATAIGKDPCDLLFNRPVTVDYRDKELMKRMVGYANRMDLEEHLVSLVKQGVRLTTTIAQYPRRYPPKMRRCLGFEVSGVPKAIKKELIGDCEPEERGPWFNIESVQSKLQQDKRKIKNVVEHFPDIDNLQVIGTKIVKPDYQPTEEELRAAEEARKPPTRSIYDYIKQFRREAELRKAQARCNANTERPPPRNTCIARIPHPPCTCGCWDPNSTFIHQCFNK